MEKGSQQLSAISVILREKEIVEFGGAPKTGGYYFTSNVADI